VNQGEFSKIFVILIVVGRKERFIPFELEISFKFSD
jgi:hypothetical protein